MTRWWDYVERGLDARGWSKADLSRATDVDQSVIGRWQNEGAAPVPRSVRGVALAFGRDVREAAIAADMFTAEELTAPGQPLIDPYMFDLSVIPNERLRDEVYARMRGAAPQHPAPPRRQGVPGSSVTLPTAPGHTATDLPGEAPGQSPPTKAVSDPERNGDGVKPS